MLPTPSTSHVSFTTIYEPAEDSFLLLDTLSSTSETAWLHSHLRSTSHPTASRSVPLVLELGTGSGVVIAFLAANAEVIFGQPVLALGTDVNRDACRATEVTVTKALKEQRSGSVYLGSTSGDLGSALIRGQVDVLVFNPPYVPTETLPSMPDVAANDTRSFERDEYLLSLSYAGGRDGMETTNRLLESLPEILSERGVAYVLLCAQNKPEEVKAQVLGGKALRRDGGMWRAETVGKSGKTAGWEKLEIIRIWQDTDS